MEQHEMVALIRDGVSSQGGVWADLGLLRCRPLGYNTVPVCVQ
jgi:hypothetical protein